jgi:hypothetical protein
MRVVAAAVRRAFCAPEVQQPPHVELQAPCSLDDLAKLVSTPNLVALARPTAK